MPTAIKTGPSSLDLLGLGGLRELPNEIDKPTLEPPSTIPLTGGATWKGLGAGLLGSLGKAYEGLGDPSNVETTSINPGAALVSPLVTLFKDAEGVPSQSIRAGETARFLEQAKEGFGGKIQEAAQWFANRWPRVAAHMNLPIDENLRNPRGNTIAAMIQPSNKATQGLPRDVLFTEMGERLGQSSLPEARAAIVEEGGHTAQNLIRADKMKAQYKPTTDKYGYDFNPYEISVKGRAEQGLLGDYRAKTRLSRDNTPFNIDEGMANLKGGKNPYEAVKDVNPLDDNEVTKQFKEMMYQKYGKVYPNTIYDKSGKVISQVNAPARASRNTRLRPARTDFTATVTPD